MTEELPYWITTCFMCKQEFKVGKSWNCTRRFCSFECKRKWQKEKSFWD